MKRKVIVVLVVVLVVIQFIPVKLNQTDQILKNDITVVTQAPKEIVSLLKNSCYDCHSNHTVYPWYDKVAPVSWWVAYHINEAKEELNFSEWGTYSQKRKTHKLEEILEELEEKEMPLSSYLIMHADAKISSEQYEQLKNWVETIK